VATGDEGVARLAAGGRGDLFLRDHLAAAFLRAERVDIVVAFAQPAGVALLRGWLLAACGRGARVRVLVSDYLAITHPRALRGLVDVMGAACAAGQGALEARVIERAAWSQLGPSFHIKGWIFEGAGGFGRAWVGSSNLSYAALEGGLEWNLRLDRGDDPQGFAQVCGAFDGLWRAARGVDEAWIAAYEAAREPAAEVELASEALAAPPVPHAVQREALEALRASREAGHSRALVVMATGLGKTWLAAMEARASGAARVLWIAHRLELLEQAGEVMRRAMPDAAQGWCVGGRVWERGAQVVLASVGALSQPERLAALAAERFDLVVIDEAHHAPAASYQRVLGALDAGFVLGLTATPERMDLASVAGVFHDHIAYRAELARGLREGFLVAVRYWGMRDVVDYGAVRFGAGRFDEAQLAEALEAAHEARMALVWGAWQAHPGRRTLVFCQSVAHAQAVGGWLRGRGVRVAVVWAGAGSADRQGALEALASGDLDAICAVDLFNEGIDVPSLDRVVLLRPTESPVIFLQQLGRGLRRCEGKEAVTVIDLVGNHRVFMSRFYTLFGALGADVATLRAEIASGQGVWEGEGWSVSLALEAVDVLGALLGERGAREQAWALYEEAWARAGARPSAALLYRMGGLGGRAGVGDVRAASQGWFDVLAARGALGEEERAAWADVEVRGWLGEVERGRYNKSFKLVVLRALLEAGALWTGLAVEELCARCYGAMRGDAVLWGEVGVEVRGLSRSPDAAEAARWAAYWRGWPLDVWTGQERRQVRGTRGAGRRVWFGYEDECFVPRFEVPPEHRAATAAMTGELVEFLLARMHASV
jgi:superfamily II DNA or RNA helicase/HKD family nuclease